MPLIFYTDHHGNMYEADVPVGNSVMSGAVDNGIDGILGECDGAMRCATCHCYVSDDWLEKTGTAQGSELDMIAATSHPKPTSRLSCQIVVTEELDGLSVELPESQW